MVVITAGGFPIGTIALRVTRIPLALESAVEDHLEVEVEAVLMVEVEAVGSTGS